MSEAGYRFVDERTVELTKSGVELSEGDIIDTPSESQDKRQKIIDLGDDGYVTSRFLGKDHPKVSQGNRGAELLSVLDLKFNRSEYEIMYTSG